MIAQAISWKWSWQRRVLIDILHVSLLTALFLRLMVNPPYQLQQGMCADDMDIIPTVWLPKFCIEKSLQCRAAGAAKWQVLALLGPPHFDEMNLPFPGCPLSVGGADEAWEYEIGGGDHMMLFFSKDSCTLARPLDDKESSKYEEWKIRRIEKAAVGLTESEVEELVGNGFLKQDTDPWPIDAPSKHEPTKGPVSYWRFYVGEGREVALEMQNGFCISAHDVTLFY